MVGQIFAHQQLIADDLTSHCNKKISYTTDLLEAAKQAVYYTDEVPTSSQLIIVGCEREYFCNVCPMVLYI